MFLPDINFWLAAAFNSHIHHPAARNWFEAVSQRVSYFCRMTQQGFFRLATDVRIVGKQAVTLHGAWGKYDDYLADPRVGFAEEPEGLEAHWRAFTQRRTFSPKVWTDAYLAAFARAADFEVVTFDRGFRQFKNVKCTVLS